MSPPVAWREYRASDFKFVMDSWGKSWRESPWAGTVPNNLFHRVFTEAVGQLIARGANLLMMVSPVKDDQILGWVCWEPVHDGLALHYVYVKDPWRRSGLGTRLVAAAEAAHGTQDCKKFYTHRTRFSDSSVFRDYRHAPEIARRK